MWTNRRVMPGGFRFYKLLPRRSCRSRRLCRAAELLADARSDDLAQETALAVFRGRGYFSPDRGRLTTWLAQMTSRTAFAVRKSVGAAKRTAPGEYREPLQHVATTGTPCGSGDFWQALERILTPQEAKAIALRFGEELETAEIGRRLGFQGSAISKGASASRVINDALKKLHRRRFDLRRAAGLS